MVPFNTKFLIGLIICLLVGSIARGQNEFARVFGGKGQESANAVVQTLDGGYLVAGSTGSLNPGGSEPYLLKVDSAGKKEWWRYYTWEGSQEVTDLIQRPDSSFVFLGYTNGQGAGGYDLFLQTTDKNGDSLSSNLYGGTDWEFSGAFDTLPGGGMILCGTTFSYGKGPSDLYLLRIDPSGDTLWTETLGNEREEWGYGVEHVPGFGFAMTGQRQDTTEGFSRAYLVGTDENGTKQWETTVGDTLLNRGEDLVKTKVDSDLVVTGTVTDPDQGDRNILVMRTDLQGNIKFRNGWGPPNERDEGFAVAQNAQKDILVAGLTTGFEGPGQLARHFKISAGGFFLEGTTYPSDKDDHLRDLALTPRDTGAILTGGTKSFGPGNRENIYLIKDSNPIGIDENVTVGRKEHGSDRFTRQTSLFPNPCRNKTRIRIPQTFTYRATELSLKVYNGQGKLVHHREEPFRASKSEKGATITLDCSDLDQGVHFVRLIGKERQWTAKLLVGP